MTSTVTVPEICRLADADAASLLQIWKETRGTAPPNTFTARLMRLTLAWEVQAASEGGASAKDSKRW